MKKTLIIAALFAPLLMAAGNGNTGKSVARDPGTKVAVGKSSTVAFAAREDRLSFCLKADKSNTDTVAFSCSATITTASGIQLQAGEGICLPIGAEGTYQGVVTIIAVTTAGTHNIFKLEN